MPTSKVASCVAALLFSELSQVAELRTDEWGKRKDFHLHGNVLHPLLWNLLLRSNNMLLRRNRHRDLPFCCSCLDTASHKIRMSSSSEGLRLATDGSVPKMMRMSRLGCLEWTFSQFLNGCPSGGPPSSPAGRRLCTQTHTHSFIDTHAPHSYAQKGPPDVDQRLLSPPLAR